MVCRAEADCPAVSLGRYSGQELTGPGQKAWITPPGCGGLQAELHGNSALDREDLHIPLGRRFSLG